MMSHFFFYQSAKHRKLTKRSKKRNPAEPRSGGPPDLLPCPPVIIFQAACPCRAPHLPLEDCAQGHTSLAAMGTAPGQTRLSDLWNTTRTQRHRAVSPPLALEEPDVVDPGAAGRATMLAVIDKTNGDPDGRKFVIHCALADVKRVTHWIAPQSSRRKVRVLGKGRGEMPVEQLEALVKAGFSPLTIEIQSEECPGQGCEQA